MNQPSLTGAEKLEEVARLMSALKLDLKETNLTDEQRVHIVLQLRQHGTNPKDADPIYSPNGMGILVQYGVNSVDSNVRRAALRCIANALLLEPKMRQIFVDTGYGGSLAERLKVDNSEDEMIASRILFLSTYGTTMDFENLVNEHALGQNINYQIFRHAKQFSEDNGNTISQIDELALTDTLKLMFNISKIYPNLATAFSPSIPYFFEIIRFMDTPTRPLDGLLSNLINCLSTLDIGVKDSKLDSTILFPDFNQNGNVDKLIKILDLAVSIYQPEDLDIKAIPLLQVLITIYELAPRSSRNYMERLLLEDNDRSQPRGKSDTLPSRLLRLSTAPYTKLKTAISELMFVLSANNPETLTKNIGYGFASGILASRGIEIPQMTGESFASRSSEYDPEINPITGQKWSAEPKDSGPIMTQEQKEREAERLFVLFERARANGILKVENPIAQAVREGRFEELPDDYESEGEGASDTD